MSDSNKNVRYWFFYYSIWFTNKIQNMIYLGKYVLLKENKYREEQSSELSIALFYLGP